MDISLLNAGLAAGAALASIPVILHLFMKQTPKRVVFPALRLIRERNKRSRKRLRIKNWLLLLARMALVALMALALARPALNSQASLGDREVPTALALVFDTSLSMEYRDRNETRLAAARKLAEDILKRLPETSQVYVIDSSEPVAPPSMSPAAARKRLDTLALHAANRPLNVAVGLAYRAVAGSDRPRREVYVLTDLERSSWSLDRSVEGLDAAKKAKPAVSTFVLRLTPKDISDVAIVEAVPSESIATQGEPVTINAVVRASGPATRRVVELFVDADDKGKPKKRDQKAIDIPANGEERVSFRTANLAAGLHQGEVRLSGGTDPMTFDDRRFFSFHVQPAMKVMVVADRRIDLEFIADALAPPTFSGPRPFQVERVLTSQLPEVFRKPQPLRDFACVFLNNVKELSESEWGRFSEYVRQGGGLVVGLGDKSSPDNYNSLVAGQLIPATLGEIKSPKDPFSFGKADYKHPLFGRYPKELDAELTGVPVFRYWGVTPAKGGSRTVVSFQDGAPALIERVFQGAKAGHVLLWTTPLARRPPGTEDKAAWNEFPLPISGWAFFYLINQTVPYLAGVSGERLNFEAGEDVIIPIDPTRRVSSYVVQSPDNKVTDQLSPLASNPQLVIQSPQALGQWTVTASSKGGPQQTLGFSVNAPLGESTVAPLETRDLESLFGKGNYALADDPENLKHVTEVTRVGHELFPWLMAILLAIVTAENLLANRFHRERGVAPAVA